MHNLLLDPLVKSNSVLIQRQSRGDSCQRDWTQRSDFGQLGRRYLVFLVPAVRLSTFILLFLPSSSVSLSYFNLTVSMCKCSGQHSITIQKETPPLRS